MKKIPLYGQFSCEILTQATPELIDHMSRTIHGTPGRLQYKLDDVSRKMKAIRNCYYLTLWRSNRLLGMIGIVKRQTRNKGIRYTSWYLRYFSIFAPMRSAKHIRKERQARKLSSFSSMLKSIVASMIDNPGKFLEGSTQSEQGFIYGYIEKENERSQQFSDIGDFVSARKLNTLIFSRFKPRLYPQVSRIMEQEKPLVLEYLDEFYQQHTMFTTDNIFYGDNYCVYCRDGEIVAGLQANPETWSIKSINGLSGWFIMNVLPRIPGLSSIVDPDDFRFIAMEGMFYRDGNEDCLIPLVESACHIAGVHIAITWLDTGDPLLKTFDTLNKYGTVNLFVKRIPADIKVKFIQWEEKDMMAFGNSPAYISCFDVT